MCVVVLCFTNNSYSFLLHLVPEKKRKLNKNSLKTKTLTVTRKVEAIKKSNKKRESRAGKGSIRPHHSNNS